LYTTITSAYRKWILKVTAVAVDKRENVGILTPYVFILGEEGVMKHLAFTKL